MAGNLFGWNNAAMVARAAPVVIRALDRVVERYAVEAGENAKPLTPVQTGTLQKSLSAQEKWTPGLSHEGRPVKVITGKRLSGMKKMERMVGSSLPYAAAQEFEHRTKKLFIHRGVKSVGAPMKVAAITIVKQILGDQWNKGGAGIG